MMGKVFSKGQYIVFIYIFLLIATLTSPFWLWGLEKDTLLKVLILDKTVPDDSFREHKGLVWVLNNEKYVKSDNQPYSMKTDYFGFIPNQNNQYKIKSLPNQLANYDVLYLADQYGVYEEEFYQENRLGERSNLLYGGLNIKEVEVIEDTLLHDQGKTLIAEFNTFASPTEEAAKAKISNLLNVDWSGWIGRYFIDLSNDEVPSWVKEQYEGQWDFKGEGLVFVNKNNYVMVVEDKDLQEKGIHFQLTEAGKSYFNENLDSLYTYWFDIVDARSDEEVLANFHLPVSDKTKQSLTEVGIPTIFPAVTLHRNNQYTSYYFSGDFTDEAEVPNIYQTKGISLWKKYIGGPNSFYWKTYVPLMKNILAYGLHHKKDRQLVEMTQKQNITINSKTGDQYIQIKRNGKWENFLIKGVNMGIAKPGYFPGETAITKDEYLRWFKAIGKMNANAIRVYTLHPPDFYEALFEYNKMAESPLFLFHGIWVSEESLLKTKDAFSNEVVSDFQSEIRQMIDIIHGKASIPKRPGHASGEYKVDVSQYILGFILGIEWDPDVVQQTNEKNKGIAQWNGKYFMTTEANPFEIWLARNMEYAAVYESEKHGWQHTMSFTNWVTTDLLKHPAEPSESEDLVTVNPNHIQKKAEFTAGLFASYHIYPYYPDFLNYERKYLYYKDIDGQYNNYAGYLNDLIQVHDMPVVVAEFGVPSSRGLTHLNAYGMNQGFHTEQEQGDINKRLYKSIVNEGYAGGIIFSWQDEWFKRTWNTMELDNPNRRPFWSNAQTNEQHFGLLSFEPGTKEQQIYIDGLEGDWKKLKQKPLFQASKQNKFVQQINIHADPGYVYFKLKFKKPLNWKEDDIYLLLDTIDNQGQSNIQLADGLKIDTQRGIDFVINLKDESSSNIMVDSYYDPFYYQYGELLQMIEPARYASSKNNGVFHPINLALNKKLEVPSTGKTYPFQAYETGKLMFGDGNPEHKEFNSLTDISISNNKKILELRVPWQLLNVKDPSTKEALGDMWKNGLDSSKQMNDIQVMILPVRKGELLNSNTLSFNWQEWEQPIFEERLKKSYFIMKEAYDSIGIKGEKK
jgi:hypothetical protein